MSLLVALPPVIFGLCVFFKLYIKFSTGWCKSQTCLVGKTAIITGSNTGIGFETALDFAKRGAKVILACRDSKKAQEAKNKIIKETKNENIKVKLVDFSSFASVRKFAKEIIKEEDRLDILVNNAGVMGLGDKKSEDGHLLVLQINYFSSFLLTNLLLGLLKRTKSSRIINVSSLTAKLVGEVNLKNLDKFSSDSNCYALSKLCNILFTKELAKKLEGTGIITCSLHPGGVKTEILRNTTGLKGLIYKTLVNVFCKTSEEGAQTSIYCSVAEEIENGEHYSECKKVDSYKSAAVPGLSKKLWEITEDIVQLKLEEIHV